MAVITPRAGDITEEQLKKYVAAMNAVSSPQQLQAIYDDLNNFLRAAGGDIQGLPRLQGLYDLVNQKYTYMTATPSLEQPPAAPGATETKTGQERADQAAKDFDVLGSDEQSPYAALRQYMGGRGIQSESPFAQYVQSVAPGMIGSYLAQELGKLLSTGTPARPFNEYLQSGATGQARLDPLLALYDIQAPTSLTGSDSEWERWGRATKIKNYFESDPGQQVAYQSMLQQDPFYQGLPGFLRPYARGAYYDVAQQYQDLGPTAQQSFFPWLKKIFAGY